MRHEFQLQSAGDSCPEIHAAALAAASARPGLRWLDIGCGAGAVLRMIRDWHEPLRLIGVDVIDWLDPDLREDVDLVLGAAERVLSQGGEEVDRVLMVEALEHLDAPWSALRAAAVRLAPGGLIVVTTPNVASMRHRLELLATGRLTTFRPDNVAHLTPILPHVVGRILSDEGIEPRSTTYVGRDIVPWTGGLKWPESVHQRLARLTSVSVVVVGQAPLRQGREPGAVAPR